MDAKRTSEQIDKELQGLRGKIRELEADKQQHGKALDLAKRERKKSAYAAHGEKDAKAQERLAKARAAQRESEFALEDLESAISEGRAKFETLEVERERVWRAEQWEKALALAAECLKEAEQLDNHIQGLAKILASHQAKLEQLRLMAVAAGRPSAFRTTGLRHLFRTLNWAVLPFAPLEVEKPSEQYRHGYGSVFREQLAAAEKAPEENPEPNGKDKAAMEAEPVDTGAESGAGATA